MRQQVSRAFLTLSLFCFWALAPTSSLAEEKACTSEVKEADVADLWARYARSPKNIWRTRLIEHYLPLANSIALAVWRKLPPCVEFEDIRSEGVLGLIDAIQKFDPARGNRFETYATVRIRGAIIDSLRRADWVPRHVRASKNARIPQILSLNQSQGDSEEGKQLTVEEILAWEYGSAASERVDTLDTWERLLQFVNPVERKMLQAYYLEGKSMFQIGEAFDLSEARISQIRKRAALKLKVHASHLLSELSGCINSP